MDCNAIKEEEEEEETLLSIALFFMYVDAYRNGVAIAQVRFLRRRSQKIENKK